MLHDGGQRHIKRFRQFADRDALASFQFGQQRAPRRVGDSGKYAVQAIGRIVNHMVKYRCVRDGVKGQRSMELRLRRAFRKSRSRFCDQNARKTIGSTRRRP